MMELVVTGGTGFLGRHLVRALSARGDRVAVLTRDAARGERQFSEPSVVASVPSARATGASGIAANQVRFVEWNPEGDGVDPDELAGADAIVHLAGAPAVGRRWTPEVKRHIRRSRIESTEAIVRALNKTARRPTVFVCASAVGYYGGSTEAREFDEDDPPGDGFLASVCADWERAAEGAGELGLRVVRVRLGLVLGPDGGALHQMVKPFKVFAGGPMGTGRQAVSWIHLDDVVRGFVQCLDDERLRGAVNFTAPKPVTNGELAQELGRTLRRPAWVPVPAAALRLRFGEGADPLLTGQHVLPRRLQEVGFAWRFPDVRSALADLLGVGGPPPQS